MIDGIYISGAIFGAEEFRRGLQKGQGMFGPQNYVKITEMKQLRHTVKVWDNFQKCVCFNSTNNTQSTNKNRYIHFNVTFLQRKRKENKKAHFNDHFSLLE